jgi:hypothetical protein
MSVLLNRLLGAFFVGVIFSSILYGVTLLQVYLYYTEHSSKDGVFLKSFVAALMVLDSIHLAFLCHGFYISAVTNFGNYLADLHAPWSLVVQSLIGVFVTTCIQQFYAIRVYQLSQKKNIYMPLVISAISATELGFAVVFTVKSFQMGTYLDSAQSVPYGASALSLEVLCGIFITTCMVYYVLQQRSGAKRTNRVVNLVILYIINSGALNLVFASTCLVTYVTFPTTLIYAPFFFVLVRLYVCSFITILNSRVNVRSRLRGERHTIVTITHEQVIDGHPHSRLGSSSSDMLAMMKVKEGRTAGDIC